MSGVTAIHLDDEGEVTRAWERGARVFRPKWDWHAFDGQSAELVVWAIKDAVAAGHQVVLISDFLIGSPYGTTLKLWGKVWGFLTARERAAIQIAVLHCSSEGMNALYTGVKFLDGFAARLVMAAKPAKLEDLFLLLPP